jgi:hypothetical protein
MEMDKDMERGHTVNLYLPSVPVMKMDKDMERGRTVNLYLPSII